MDESNPVLTRLWRGSDVESVHRGAWVMVDGAGDVIHSVGDPNQMVFGRSATKSFQALPLLESGAADAFDLSNAALALALASHSGEPMHTTCVAETLATIGVDEGALQCGPQRPWGTPAGTPEARIINNCSGKHAGFLAVARHLGEDPAAYLDPSSTVQRMVFDAVAEICSVDPTMLETAVDGCSAPTFRMPLRALATGIARIANPDQLGQQRADACRRLTAAAAEHPDLVAGTTGRLCSDLMRVTEGRLFAKIGAEAVYVVGAVGRDRGVAIKVDDGADRGYNALLIAILIRTGLLTDLEAAQLDAWGSTTRANWDGLEIGRITFGEAALPASADG